MNPFPIDEPTEVRAIFPSFVMHKKWKMADEFNERLFNLAAQDARDHEVEDANHPLNVGNSDNHISYLRHNFLEETKDKVILQLTEMADFCVREFLWKAYQFEFTGEIEMMATTIHHRRTHKENIGINNHSHVRHDVVVTYYPKVELDDDCPQTELHRGAVRFYDPANVGKKMWTNSNPNFHIGGWYSVEPEKGSMLVFDGHIPHDSCYFQGTERMVIPIMCKLRLPNEYRFSSVDQIRKSNSSMP